tara:strand:- start:595 stop:1131 length:537 start_codon:yes stop_codon:yes gene_type:complete
MKIVVPDHIGELTIEQFQAIHDTDDPVEQVAIACNIDRELINQMDLDSLDRVTKVMGNFDPTEDKNWPLIQLVDHEGVKYGFHPNLSEMTVGEYADLETLCADLYTNLVGVMSVLYRPVVEHHKKHYTIEGYQANDPNESFNRLRMDVVLGSLAFFLRIGIDFVINSNQSLKEAKDQL